MRAVLPVVVLTAACLSLIPPVATRAVAGAGLEQQKVNPLLLPRALDLYATGQFDEGMRRIVTLSGFTTEEATRWINAASRTTQDRRKLVAATAALEYASVRPFLVPRLISWARTLIAAPTGPSETEALWL